MKKPVRFTTFSAIIPRRSSTLHNLLWKRKRNEQSDLSSNLFWWNWSMLLMFDSGSDKVKFWLLPMDALSVYFIERWKLSSCMSDTLLRLSGPLSVAGHVPGDVVDAVFWREELVEVDHSWVEFLAQNLLMLPFFTLLETNRHALIKTYIYWVTPKQRGCKPHFSEWTVIGLFSSCR